MTCNFELCSDCDDPAQQRILWKLHPRFDRHREEHEAGMLKYWDYAAEVEQVAKHEMRCRKEHEIRKAMYTNGEIPPPRGLSSKSPHPRTVQ